jgi:hypothetical protein
MTLVLLPIGFFALVLVLPHGMTFLQFYEVAQVIERFLLLETIKFYTEYSTLEHKSW